MELKNGIASPPTISRMLGGIDEELALYAFMEWIGEIVDSKNTHLAIDGKALRGAAEKTKNAAAPMILNVVETVRGLVLTQLPIDSKTNEITAAPELLRLLDIRGSTVTLDAIGTQTTIIEQIHEQGGHFVLAVKGNQSEACKEIHELMDKLEMEVSKKKKCGRPEAALQEYLEKYEETSQADKNREKWETVRSIGRIRQVRIPVRKDRQGNNVRPSMEEFLKKGSGTEPAPSVKEEAGKGIQYTALISDLILSAEELGRIKRMHWSIENQLHHVLDDTFREDRSPARKSRNNLSLIRKYAYNILRLAIRETGATDIMTEMMDCFCDNAALREQYVFKGIAGLY